MFISGYHSDEVGAAQDELITPVRTDEVMNVYEAGFGQKHRRKGITIKLPTANPNIRGVGKRFPTQSSGMRQLAQTLLLSQTP
jgi:hypothetical protein